MNILFIHQNFPGQFRHIAQALVNEGDHHVLCICSKTAPGLPGVQRLDYKPDRKKTPGIHAYLSSPEVHVIRGQNTARALLALKEGGYTPDVIVAHMGWGEAIFPKDIYPSVPLITFFEFFYHAHGADVGFDPEYPASLDDHLRVRMKNMTNLLSLHAADIGISPTTWQRSLYPAEYQAKLRLLHEGIHTEIAIPDDQATLTLSSGITLTRDDEVVTYVARNLEPYRGFHVFMRAVEQIVRRRPQCHVLIVGGDQVSYGKPLPNGETFRQRMLNEVSIDPFRVHFLGNIPYQHYITVLQVSSAHVYLTYPFVLSWSMLEAMSVGCVVIGSATPPVLEVIEHDVNGLLVDFFDASAIAEHVDAVFKHPSRMQPIRDAARVTILDRYTVAAGIAGYQALFKKVTAHPTITVEG